MANICCENTDCIFCAQDGSCLYKFDVRISDNYYAGCSEYSDYMESKDYKTEFWKAFKVKDQEGKSERKKAFGTLNAGLRVCLLTLPLYVHLDHSLN